MIENDCPERCPCCYRKNSNTRLEHWFSKCYLLREFRMKYFMDIEKLYEKLFVTRKYCPISNSNVNTIILDMNNIESSIDPDSSKEEYDIYNNNDRNNIVNNRNISDSENNNIITINIGQMMIIVLISILF